MLAAAASQAGASALSAWLRRATPASAALPAPERPSQRAQRLESRRLARQAPSPDRDVVPVPRRARRASPPRPEATDDPPPPSPQGAAALGPHDVFRNISADLLAQGGRRPRPHCGPEAPPPPPHRADGAGKLGKVECRGTGNSEQCTAPGCTTSTVCSAQRTAPRQSTAHSTPQDAAHSAPQGAAHSAPQDAATAQHTVRHTVHHRAQHTVQHTSQHTAQQMQHTVQNRMQHLAQHTVQAQHIAQHTVQRTVQHARHAARRAQDNRGPCARPHCFPWGCQCGSPLRRIAPLGRPKP